MRRTVCVLAFVGAGAMSLTLADQPATPATPDAAATASPAQSAAPAPAATAAPAAKAPTPTVDVEAEREGQLEKHFLAEGYKLEMHNGEKYFCRREEQLGTRLGAGKVCGTAQQLDATEREARAAMQRGQSQQTNPKGN
jgi:hypothetical protein